MAESQTKNLWITSIQPYSVGEESYIPTAIFYESPEVHHIGNSALQKGEGLIINDNFKINLGEHTPGTLKGKLAPSNDGEDRSAFDLSQTFMNSILKDLEEEIKNETSAQHKIPAKILVAEPLSFSNKEEKHTKTWMQNYRENIRRILNRYEEVDFLPEPFAVYQYYRYGQRIPNLQDKSKHIALVLDFGGGTFDACVIESTSQGDISLTGKHSKPLAADSCAVGGFEINFHIAEYLIKRNLEGGKRKEADQCISSYKRVKNGELNYSALGEKKTKFIENFKILEREVEKYKINLTSTIKNWSLNSEAYERTAIKTPINPFDDATKWVDDEFFAHQFRKIFENEVWENHLKRTIGRVFRTAEEKLNGKSITVTLISGGSSNIRWLMEFLDRDFSDELEGATPVPISQSFQEVVANGLAIECARRFYEQESEFVSVTYNPLKLSLKPDEEESEQTRNFSSVGEKIDMNGVKPGDLMPSAQALHNFISEHLQWKIRLSKPPKSKLTYVFSKPSDSGLTEDNEVYNSENQVIYTRDNKQFDSYITVDLLIKEDGTVYPSFIYKMPNKENGVEGATVEGRPFAIDMTTGITSTSSPKNYIGFDFGTSCSSLCLLTQDQVKITAARSNDPTWTSLSDSISYLPYPVAYPLRKYLDVKNTTTSATVAREAFEAALAFMTYVTVAELYSNKKAGRIFKNFQHRSMGPLKSVLKQSIEALGNSAKFSKPIRSFLEKNDTLLERAISEFNNHKHEKLEDNAFDYHSHLSLVISCCTKLMRGKLFGYMTDMEQKPFEDDKFTGVFKVAHDVPPFTKSHAFESSKQKPRTLAVLTETESEFALPLFPLIFWLETTDSVSGMECFWYDKTTENSGSPIVKPCNKKSEFSATELNPKLGAAITSSLKEGSNSFSTFKINLEIESE
ncbi:TPA: hypothetical protein ACQRLW_005214 [Pseudomonas aeruginosa]